MVDLPAHWSSAGTPHSRLFLFLHGFLGQGQDWFPQMQALSDWGYCLAPDLPGHAGAPDGPCDFASCWDSLIPLLPAHEELIVVAYSMGGRLALYGTALGRIHPQALILESCSPGIQDAAERQFRRAQDANWAQVLLSEGPDFLTRWYASDLWQSLRAWPGFEQWLATRRMSWPHRSEALARSLLESGAGSQPPLWHVLPHLQLPTLCLTGAQDLKFCALAQAMQAIQPAWHYTTLKGGHNLHLEQPEAWLAAVQVFLKQVLNL